MNSFPLGYGHLRDQERRRDAGTCDKGIVCDVLRCRQRAQKVPEDGNGEGQSGVEERKEC